MMQMHLTVDDVLAHRAASCWRHSGAVVDRMGSIIERLGAVRSVQETQGRRFAVFSCGLAICGPLYVLCFDAVFYAFSLSLYLSGTQNENTHQHKHRRTPGDQRGLHGRIVI